MLRSTTSEIVDWICVVMIVLGSLGNSLGLIVFSSRKFRRTSYGRLAIASLIINLLCVFRYSLLLHSETRRWITYKAAQSWFNCKLYRFSSCLRILSAFVTVAWTYERFSYVTKNFHFSSLDQFKNKVKFLLMACVSFLLIAVLTGPTVYFYQPKPVFSPIFPRQSSKMFNASLSAGSSVKDEEITSTVLANRSFPMICGLKETISPSWGSFLLDVGFGLNYTTFRSIFSEIIPSLLVICFNIGIIFRVIQSRLTFASKNNSGTIRPSSQGSFQCKEAGGDGLMVHNRPRTSWMNVVLIIHSCLFFFSSLSATIVHWSTSDVLLSYWISVVILANCSLNFYVYCLSGKSFRREIRKLFAFYFQVYFWTKFLDLFRSKSEQEQRAQTVRMRIVRNRSAVLPPHCQTPSFTQRKK